MGGPPSWSSDARERETQRLRDIEGVIAVLGHQQEIADELRGVLMARYGPSLAKPAYSTMRRATQAANPG